MKWKTSIFNVNLLIFTFGFMFATIVGKIVDKSFDNVLKELISSALSAIIFTFIFAKCVGVFTDDQIIEYRTLWIKKQMKWNQIMSYQRALGNIRLVSQDEKKYMDIPIVWFKEKDALINLMQSNIKKNESESIDCLNCGEIIKSENEKCPKCGWSWK